MIKASATPLTGHTDIGHNGGPPIEEPVDVFVRYAWKQAHREAWRNPPMDILRFRVARAEAAGVSYRDYMLELLDTGRHLQAGDRPSAAPSGEATGPPLEQAAISEPRGEASKREVEWRALALRRPARAVALRPRGVAHRAAR